MRTRNTLTIGLLSFLFLISFASAAPILVERGANFDRYYDSATGKYTLQIYVGQKYVLEDGKWKNLADAKSLLGVWNVIYLKKDSNFSLNVTDINYTTITVSVASNIAGTIPFKICNSASLTEASCPNATTIVVSAASLNKAQTIIIPITNAIQYANLSWGTNSTTIQIGNGNVLGDTQVDTGAAAIAVMNMGGQVFMKISNVSGGAGSPYNGTGYVKINISSIPAGATISDAEVALTLVNRTTPDTESQLIGAFHVYNASGGYTIGTADWIQGTGIRDAYTQCYAGNFGDNRTGEITGNNRPVTSTQWNLTADSDVNVSTQANNTVLSWNVTNMTIKEFNSNVAPNRQNLSIAFMPRVISSGITNVITQCTMFNTSEAIAGKPYLNVTYSTAPTDTTAPTWSLNSTDSQVAGANITHSLYWEDAFNATASGNLSGYIFSWCNGTYNKSTVTNTTVSYNFLDNSSNKAWWASPVNPITSPIGGTEATAVQYVNMSLNDSSFARVLGDATTNDDPYWTMNFTINQTNTTINSINVSLGGFKVLTGGSEAATCYVWNWTNGAWFSFGTLGTSPATISVNITSQIPTLINASTKILNVYCTGAQFDLGEGIYIDFVNVAVNYNSTSYSNENCSDGTATLSNDSWVAMTGASNWSNVSKVVNSTVGSIIKWCVYANDSANNWNYSSCTVPFNYTTTAAQQGNVTSQPVYDSFTYAELATTAMNWGRTLYDAGTYAELQLRNLTLTLQLYDYKTYSELLVASALHPRTFYDSVTYSELQTKLSIFPRVLYDSATYAENMVKNSTFYRVLYDYNAYAELVVKNSTFIRTLYDYGTYAELTIKNSIFVRVLFDAVSYAELQIRTSVLYRILYDTATYYETAFGVWGSSFKTYFVYLYDTALYAENVLRGLVLTIRIYDAVSYAEMLYTNYQMFFANVVQAALSYIPPLNIPPVRIDFSWISVIILGCICVFGANYLRNRKPNSQDEETLNEEFPDTEE